MLLKWLLGADSTPFNRALLGLEGQAEKAGKKIANKFSLGAAAAGLAFALARQFTAAFERAQESAIESARTGLMAEELTALNQIAKESGRSLDELVKILNRGGDAASRLRANMATVGKEFGTGPSQADTNALAFGGDMGTAGGNFLQRLFARRMAGPIRAAGIGMGWMRGIGAGFKTLFGGGSFSDAQGAFLDSVMGGINGPEDAAKRKRLQSMELELAEKQLKREEKRKSAEARANAKELRGLNDETGALASLITGNAPKGDALSQVGIFTARSGQEAAQYQRTSLKWLEQIANNTARAKELAPPDVEP